MLFDLRGRRRRAVQATYVTLAVLMGGGLVFFGIGGGVSGGLLDAFKGGGGGSSGNDLIQKRIGRNEKRARLNPRDVAALKALVRDNYQLAASQTQSGATGFPASAKGDLRKAAAAWQRYLAAEPGKPDPSLATVAFQLFSVDALNKPKQAQQAATIIAEAQNNSPAYIQVVQYATLAGDKRTADLAAKKAIDLAPKAQKKTVESQVKQAKQTQAQAPPAPG
jgi:hypothetical protein